MLFLSDANSASNRPRARFGNEIDSIGERVALTQDPGDFARLPVDDARQDQVQAAAGVDFDRPRHRCWGLRVVLLPTERSGTIIQAGMHRLLHAHITPRAGVSTDHGPLVRNPLNNSSKADEPCSVRTSLVRERQ